MMVDMLLEIAMFVFFFLVLGIGLTVYEFRTYIKKQATRDTHKVHLKK